MKLVAKDGKGGRIGFILSIDDPIERGWRSSICFGVLPVKSHGNVFHQGREDIPGRAPGWGECKAKASATEALRGASVAMSSHQVWACESLHKDRNDVVPIAHSALPNISTSQCLHLWR